MISNSSLSAFSAAATTAPVKGLQQPRLVRDQVAQSTAPTNALPAQRPSVSPPRGTLLNLSV